MADRIAVEYDFELPEFERAPVDFAAYIKTETQAVQLTRTPGLQGTALDINGATVMVKITKQ